jgi:hypothetical protein
VQGAERFGQEIAVVETVHARHRELAKAFQRFFMETSQTAYPEGGFAVLGPGEFGQRLEI